MDIYQVYVMADNQALWQDLKDLENEAPAPMQESFRLLRIQYKLQFNYMRAADDYAVLFRLILLEVWS